nr:MAG TPA: hypothetical protein [Caudoviricetes sp.]
MDSKIRLLKIDCNASFEKSIDNLFFYDTIIAQNVGKFNY